MSSQDRTWTWLSYPKLTEQHGGRWVTWQAHTSDILPVQILRAPWNRLQPWGVIHENEAGFPALVEGSVPAPWALIKAVHCVKHASVPEYPPLNTQIHQDVGRGSHCARKGSTSYVSTLDAKFSLLPLIYLVSGTGPRVLYVLGKHFITEL